MKVEITYKDWINAYEKNIKPLPSWWNNEELRKKEYDSFRMFCLTGKVQDVRGVPASSGNNLNFSHHLHSISVTIKEKRQWLISVFTESKMLL